MRVAVSRRRSRSRTPPCSHRPAVRPLTRRGGFPSTRFPSRISRRWVPWISPLSHRSVRLVHTPRSGLPGASRPTAHYARHAFDLPSAALQYDTIMPPSCREKLRQFDGPHSVRLHARPKALIQQPKSRSCCSPPACAFTLTDRITVPTDLQRPQLDPLHHRVDPVALAHRERRLRFRTSDDSVHVPAQWTESSFRKNGTPHGQDNVKDRSRDR